jgi:hypothetical protein
MREFVFRGKPKNEAEYEPLRELSEDNCENGFVYGSLVVSHNKYYICTMALQIRGGISNYITTMIDVLPDTVGQYTGLKDKNGTKIFEGDIVLLKGDEEPYQVAFDESCFQVYGNSICYVMDNFYDHDIEVIGNIYDNPELLEGDGSA